MFVPVPTRHRPVWAFGTPLVVAVSAIAFAYLMMSGPVEASAVLQRFGTVPESLVDAHTWSATFASGRAASLVTAQFLHADWVHLIGNLVFILIFGPPTERAIGPWRFLLLYIGCGAAANLAAALLSAAPASPIVGSSGAISGLVGAWLALFPRARLGFVLPLGVFVQFVRTPAWLPIGIWAMIQLLFAFVGPAFGAVAWWTHAAGFATGLAVGFSWRSVVVRRRRLASG